MKKCFKITLFALLAAALLASAVVFSGVLTAGLRRVPAEIPELARISPSDDVPPGEKVEISFDFVLPAGWQVKNAVFECGKDAVAVSSVQLQHKSWRWDRESWSGHAAMRPLRSGEIGEGKIILTSGPWWSDKVRQQDSIAVPSFSSVIPAAEKAGSELQLAGRMTGDEERSSGFISHLARYKYYYLAAILLILAAAIWLIRRLKNVDAVKLPVWEMALNALEELRELANHRMILPSGGYNRLNDILRDYLEIRFDLPASRRTTPEFLAELAAAGSLLPDRFQVRLAEFLNSADLIRFAKVPADLEHLEEAIDKVKDFVKTTIPQTGSPDNNSEEALKK